MRLSSAFLALSLPTLFAIACSSSSSGSGTGDAGSSGASGSSGAPGSSGSSGAPGSSGSSGSSGSMDAGSSGASGSSGTSGSSGSSGSSGAVDSGTTCPTTANFAGCVEADAGPASDNTFVDYGATDPTVQMITGDYVSGTPSSYVAKCIKIKLGQTVSWSGDFLAHPLVPASCNPSTGGEIPTLSSGSGPATFKPTAKGIWGFQCLHHSPAGMKGVIVVY